MFSASSSATDKVKDPGQVQDLCFTVKGYATRCPEAFSPLGRTSIRAYDVNTLSWTDVIKKAKEKKEESSLWRPELTLTTQEKDTAEPKTGTREYLLVGFACYPLPEGVEFSRVNKGIAGGRRMGQERPRDEDLIESAEGRLPLLVVCRVERGERPSGCKLWVLMKPKGGLCTPYSIAQEYVFYLPEFRCLENRQRNRGPAWNTIVLNRAHQPSDPDANVPRKKEAIPKSAKGPSRLIRDSRASLVNEAITLLKSFEQKEDIGLIDQAVALLEDIRARPAKGSALSQWIDTTGSGFTTEDATKLEVELRKSWPQVEGLTASRLFRLREGLEAARILLPDIWVKRYIAAGLKRVDDWDEENLAYEAEGLMETASDMIGEPRIGEESDGDEDDIFPHTLLARLGEAAASWKPDDKEMPGAS